MRKSRKLAFCLAAWGTLWAGPVDFGKQEFQRALADRKLSPQRYRVQTEVSTDAPESFRIVGARISGGDVRGLMYGLLEASEQIRSKGWLTAAKASATIQIRGVRLLVQAEDLGGEWFYTPAYWDEVFATLARSRFNRLNLVFGENAVLSGRVANAVRAIAQTALGYAVDLAVSLEPGALGAGGPEVKSLLATSPAIRSVQWRRGSSDAPSMRLPEALLGALLQSGRRVTLEFPSQEATSDLVAKVAEGGIPWRLSEKYSDGQAKPAHPDGTEILWEIEAPSAEDRHNPAFVRGVMQNLLKAAVAGLDIDGPLPVASEVNRSFYLLWGRLSYDPKTPASVWEPKAVNKP
jgi:hypothetical protein